MNYGDTFLRIFETIPGSLQKIHSKVYADLLCCVFSNDTMLQLLRAFVENVEKSRCLLETFFPEMALYSNAKRTSK